MSLLRSPWVSGGLAAVALGIVAYQVLSSGRSRGRPVQVASAAVALSAPQPTTAAPPKPAPPLPVSSSPPVTTGTTPIDREFVLSHLGEWIDSPKRDPFHDTTERVAPARPSPVPGWKLSAIWRQTDSRVATINGAIHQEGDEIEGYRIERIESDKVWFRGPTGSETLGFGKSQGTTNAFPTGTKAAPGAESPARSDFRPVGTNAPYRALPLIEN